MEPVVHVPKEEDENMLDIDDELIYPSSQDEYHTEMELETGEGEIETEEEKEEEGEEEEMLEVMLDNVR